MRRTVTSSLKYKGFICHAKVQNFFTGRIWIEELAPFPQPLIDIYMKRGFLKERAGIEMTRNNILKTKRYRCGRCLNEMQHEFIEFDCARCEKKCVYCRHCINMGRVSNCTTLITWHGPQPRQYRNHTLDWQSQFTKLQAKAAEELDRSLQQGRSHLLHAVCGAGKTEILFQATYSALKAGKRVAIATPRTDVVLELFPRFQQVFPNTTIHALYGNAPQQEGFAQLVLATTHQLYRFEHAFDVMIVDEADAFPYTFDETLQRAVLKAKKPDMPIGFVTATPSPKLLKRMKDENWGYSFIPQRYHGYPLPVPRYDSLFNYDKAIQKGQIPKKLRHWLEQQLANQRPFLIFFPTIELMEVAVPLFQQIDAKIEAVHAEDPDRKVKVKRLRNEEVPGLLTTTILERGVTIKNVQVAIVGAESPIFTDSALIQISGRAGRNANFPDGDIVFFHHGVTFAMDQARAEIIRMNEVDISDPKVRKEEAL